MNLDFDDARWQATIDAHEAWWASPSAPSLFYLTAPGRMPGRPEPAVPTRFFTCHYDESVSPEAIVDRWAYDLESKWFLGDAFPWVLPNFGPGVIAAYLGCQLVNGNDTTWFEPLEADSPGNIRLEFDPDNPWFRRTCAIYEAAVGTFGDRVMVGMTDLGGNLDIPATLRGPENLALDLYDDPEGVEQLTGAAHAMWWKYFEEISRIAQRGRTGYSAWTPFYSSAPYYILQCDFSYMIGTEAYERFAVPELAETCRKLANPFYHLDGPGALKHLDSLLAIPELKGIQWIPGAGQPPLTEWPDVLRKIRAAGKSIQFFTHQDPLGWRAFDKIADLLGDDSGIMMYGEVAPDEIDEARELVARHRR